MRMRSRVESRGVEGSRSRLGVQGLRVSPLVLGRRARCEASDAEAVIDGGRALLLPASTICSWALRHSDALKSWRRYPGVKLYTQVAWLRTGVQFGASVLLRRMHAVCVPWREGGGVSLLLQKCVLFQHTHSRTRLVGKFNAMARIRRCLFVIGGVW